jgi:hypothetical protein
VSVTRNIVICRGIRGREPAAEVLSHLLSYDHD